jgi:hypothetical protein
VNGDVDTMKVFEGKIRWMGGWDEKIRMKDDRRCRW